MKKSLLVLLLAAIFLPFSIFIFEQYFRFDPLTNSTNSGNDLVIKQDGQVLQNQKLVARFLPENEDLQVNIPIPSSNNIKPTNYSLHLILPKEIDDSVLTLKIISNQKTDGMKIEHGAPVVIEAILPAVEPDSKTSIQINVPSDYLSVPINIRLLNWFVKLPNLFWFWICYLTVLIALWLMSKRNHRLKISSNQQRQIQPNNLSAIECSVLSEGQLKTEDISALIFDLARNGHLQIVAHNDETYFIRQYNTKAANKYENILLDLLAPKESRPGSLHKVLAGLKKEHFSRVVKSIFDEIYHELGARGFIKDDIHKVRRRYKFIGFLVQILGASISFISYLNFGKEFVALIWIGLTFYLVGWVIFWIGFSLVPLTSQGVEALWQIGEFSNYLGDIRQISRTKWENDLYYRYLPYALALKQNDSWFARFAGNSFYIPDWFVISDLEITCPLDFYSQLQKVVDAFAEVFTIEI